MKEYNLSRQLANKLDKLEAFINKDHEAKKDLAFLAKIFIAANLPHRDPKNTQHWIKRNGKFTLRIAGGERYINDEIVPVGLPYGSYARLLLIWITSQALIHNTRVIKVSESLSSLMKTLGILPTGGKNGSIPAFKDQFLRLCSCKVTIEANNVSEDIIGTQFFLVEDKYVRWLKENYKFTAATEDSEVILSEKFFEHIINGSVPFDLRVVSALKQSPLALDAYMFLTYRTFILKQPTIISWTQLHDQMGSQYSDINNFRTKFLKVLSQIHMIYPELRATTVKGGLRLSPSTPHISYQERQKSIVQEG